MAITLFLFTPVSIAKPTYLFCHGVGGNGNDVQVYVHYDILPKHSCTFDFNDFHDGKFDPTKSALGQKDDIDTLFDRFNQLDNSQGVVLFGLSRGAATVINFAGKKQPTNVKAIIVESPFAHIDDIISNMLSYGLSYVLPTNTIMKAIYPLYNRNAEQPINFVTKIDKSIPILFICSEGDQLIPYTSTLRLYEALSAQGGRINVSLLTLQQGGHANLCDQEKYKQAVHHFLRKNGCL